MICEHQYPLEHQSHDIAKLKGLGADAVVHMENAWDILRALEQKYGEFPV